MYVRKLLFILILSGLMNDVFSQTKRAMIVAIGNYPYPNTNGWPKIDAGRDKDLIKATLLNQGLLPENIAICLNQAATKQGIKDSLEKLFNVSGKGDIVVIHFSAHGVQIEDNDISEEPDLLDEAIVPYGARYSGIPNDYDSIKDDYYRDDELGEYITRLRNKLGKTGNALLIFDACHSGTLTKGMGDTIRGPHGAIVSPGFEKRKLNAKPDSGVINEKKVITQLNKDAATYVSVSASQSYQVNRQCPDDNNNSIGSLSYAFCKSMAQLKEGATYKILFTLIQNIMSLKVPAQNPVLEGDGVDKILFENKYIAQKPYMTISLKDSKKESIVLNGGSIWGVTKGSRIGFYDIQTLDPSGKVPLTTGKVNEVKEFSSVVIPDKPDSGILSNNIKAFVTELAWGERKMKLAFFDAKGNPAAQSVTDDLKKALQGFELTEFTSNYDYYLQADASNKKWRLFKRNSFGNEILFDRISIADSNEIKNFKKILTRIDRAEFLKSLEITENGLSAKAELVFLINNDFEKMIIDSVKLKKRTVNGRLELMEDDIVFLKIENKSDKRIYYNIVDIQPDGIIRSIVPKKDLKDRYGNNTPIIPGECKLERNESTIINREQIEIGPPCGIETFKVFLSDKIIDLEAILVNEETNPGFVKSMKGGSLSKLEEFFINSKVGNDGKRVQTKGDANKSGTMFNYIFIIKKRAN